ncbi:metallophosphoesterase family protein [Neobacillus sp. SM06]|uniref:metallophosphoesterase family protein n=1 Tax=Neobacillus sp. SM06 TaxID=3422492 RepID=UPI003D27322F
MKLAFISDIHGNAAALEAVLADIKQRKVDRVLVLGDLCYRGPEPKRALELVRALKTDVIKGNADEWVIRGVEKGEVPDQALEMMNKEREWIRKKLDEESIDYLRKLPNDLQLESEGVKIHAFHATPASLFDVVLPDENDETIISKMMVKEADVYVYAHIHKPYVRYLNGKCIVNIGSVGLPFDGMRKASYMILELEKGCFQASITRVGYEVEKVIKQLKESDYPNTEQLTSILKNARI